MKNNIMLFSCALFFVALPRIKAQEKNLEITYDFAAPKIPSVQKIKPKQSIEVVLQNINPYIYDVSINDSLIVYQATPPSLFGEVFKMPELNAVPATAPPADPKVAGKLPTRASAAFVTKENETALQGELNIYLAKYSGKETGIKDILSLSTVPTEIAKLLEDCSATLADLKAKADAFIIDKIPSLTAATIPLGIQAEIEKTSTSARRDLELYLADGVTLKKKYQDILENSDPSLKLAEYRSVEKDIRAKMELLDKVMDNGKKLLDKLTSFDDAKVGVLTEETYKKVQTSRIEKRFVRTTMYNTDEVLINVNVKKKKEVFCSPEIGNFPISAIVEGGVKIDFSTGLVFNIGRRNLFEQHYHYDSVYRSGNILADSVTITRNRNHNIVVPSLGVFFHVYSRLLEHVNGGGLIGASVGSDQHLYYHIGGCVLLGKSDRLIIGGGVSISKSRLLSGQYQEGQIIKRSLAPTEIPTDDPTRVGGFVSITWNLNIIK
jgi:hypothetical protein